jgi:methyl-accepting chemotaxis protein
LRDIYAETTQEVLRLHLTSQQYGNAWTRMFARMRYDSEVYEKSVEKIADAYAKVAYTADKALGGKKYDESRKQLENLAEQQILIQKQINEEQSKKKTDHGKIEEWQRQIQEIAEEMATIINEMLENIIGYTAADLASELGDAFFEAAKQGEDAMEAWRKKVNDIVADVLQRMLVQKYLEERIGGIFDRYKKEWFGNDGTFKGIDAVIGSMNGFAGELNQVGEEFNAIYQGLSDSLKNYFTGDAEREGTSKGITSESQDSAFERNARLTTIQGHTYTLVQGMNDLNRTGNAVLDKLTGIEKNTSETNDKLDKVDKSIKDVKNMVDEIDRKGLKLRS